jgi:hypothetical protein
MLAFKEWFKTSMEGDRIEIISPTSTALLIALKNSFFGYNYIPQ